MGYYAFDCVYLGICLVENESNYDTSKVSHYPPLPGGGMYRSYGIFQVSSS